MFQTYWIWLIQATTLWSCQDQKKKVGSIRICKNKMSWFKIGEKISLLDFKTRDMDKIFNHLDWGMNHSKTIPSQYNWSAAAQPPKYAHLTTTLTAQVYNNNQLTALFIATKLRKQSVLTKKIPFFNPKCNKKKLYHSLLLNYSL